MSRIMIDQDTSSSDDDDLDILFLDLAFAPKRNLGVRISLQDISEEDCEWLFRCSPCSCNNNA